MDWRPTASRAALARRAEILALIREHFAAQGVLEVDTPLLGLAAAGDPALSSFRVELHGSPRYLQTSPEYAMKRLLAAGSGDVYQICKAFRDEEDGPLHRPEFTLLEWYRLGFDHHALMDDVAALLARVLPGLALERATFAALARRCGAPDPHLARDEELAAWAAALGFRASAGEATDRLLLLDLLLSEVVRRAWPPGQGGFVYDFPVGQAAYARIRPGSPPIASRFELIVDGVELANGWHELGDGAGQRARHAAEDAVRRARGQAPRAPDPRLLAALDHGLPDCAGVALGVDRLVMLATGARELGAVLAFGADWT
ncbi:MAG TPA: EF-P lysine aminoacylase EpmA [Gammaproteobacteria bacterium]|nr:EF-P lysine aminoacylase EpmA [Gammaproteobacteria bacterium]